MPVNEDSIKECIKKLTDAYQRFALGNEGFARVDRFDVHYPEVDLKITVCAKETGRDPIFHRRHTLFSLTQEVQGTIDVTNIEETAKKLNLKIHTPYGNPSFSLEDAKELAEIIASLLA